MNFSSVPAYSFGRSRSQDKQEIVPGPAKYKANWKISSEKKSSNGVPFSTAPKKIKPKISRKKAEIFEHIINQDSSFQSRLRKNSMKRYRNKNYMRSPRISIINRNGSNPRNMRLKDTFYKYKRGPGSYQVYGSSLSKKGSAVIPKGPKNLNSSQNGQPGPGQYLGHVSTLGKKGGVKAVAETGRLSMDKEAMRKPGPGDYYYNYSSLSKKGVSGLGPLSKKKLNESMPGPGEYESYSIFSSNKGVLIPRVGREERVEKYPGPGDYNLDRRTRNLKGVRIPRASSLSKIEKTPGPGDYNVNLSSFGVGGRKRRVRGSRKMLLDFLDRGKAFGVKKNRGNKGGKGVVFNRSKRWKNDKGFDVGPGSYDFKTSVPDVQKYLISQH